MFWFYFSSFFSSAEEIIYSSAMMLMLQQQHIHNSCERLVTLNVENSLDRLSVFDLISKMPRQKKNNRQHFKFCGMNLVAYLRFVIVVICTVEFECVILLSFFLSIVGCPLFHVSLSLWFHSVSRNSKKTFIIVLWASICLWWLFMILNCD